MTRRDRLLRDAAIAAECGSWTTSDEIEYELALNPNWLTTYGLDEIRLRDRVITKLLEENN